MPQDSRTISPAPRVLATDLDGTLIPLDGHEPNRRDLEIVRRHLADHAITLTFVTGRHLEIVEEAISQHQLPTPDWIICDVGTSVYESAEDGWRQMDAYQQHLDSICTALPRAALQDHLAAIDGLTLQEPEKQGPFKLSFYVQQDALPVIANRVRDWLSAQSAPWSVIDSVDPFTGDGLIDLLPRDVSKAYAIDWWRRYGGFAQEEIAFAGDSGNDLAALVAGYRAIVVGNADRRLAERVTAHHVQQGWKGRLHLAKAFATSGVLEGLRAFGVPRQPSLGAVVLSDSKTEFRVWAPRCESVDVELQRDGALQTFPLKCSGDGVFQEVVGGVGPGTRYAFRLNDALVRPDPRSRFQPDGVHGPSQVVDPTAYSWHDQDWSGINKADLVIYELHIGTFTGVGTFRAAIEQLNDLCDLGVTAIEIMPVAQAPGRWNWGYDGVGLYSPSSNYGTPDDFRALVDAAHDAGLAVILDVVYNHLGPEGNYLSDFGSYFSTAHHTPWGEAFNFDGPQADAVRQYIIENALYWLDEYHLDGLRLDAVETMHDESQEHILHSIRRAVSDYAATVGRHIHLIAESNRYDDRLIHPPDATIAPYDAIWCDDLMHSIYAVTAPEALHVHRPYEAADLEETLQHGYIYAGPPEHRVTPTERERVHPQGTGDDRHSFVVSLQNHDVIGNDAFGRRFHQLTSCDVQKAAAALVILSPSIPLLFQGEEIAADQRFRFFTDFEDERLRRAVVEGRAQEYPEHNHSDCISAIDPRAFFDSKLPAERNAEMREWYQELLRVRRDWRAEGLLSAGRLDVTSWVEHGVFLLRYREAEAHRFVVVRLSPQVARPASVVVHIDGNIDTCNPASLRSPSPDDETSLPVNSVIVGQGSIRVEPV